MGEDDKIVTALKLLINDAHESQNEFLIKLMREHELGVEHQFVRYLQDKAARRERMMDKLKGNIIFWGLTSATASAGWWIWKHLKW